MTDLEFVPTINMPNEIVINQIGMMSDILKNGKVIFQNRQDLPLECKPGDILEPVITGWKVYTMDGHQVKEPIFKYKIKENKNE